MAASGTLLLLEIGADHGDSLQLWRRPQVPRAWKDSRFAPSLPGDRARHWLRLYGWARPQEMVQTPAPPNRSRRSARCVNPCATATSKSIRLDRDEDRWCKLAVPNAKRERCTSVPGSL